MTESEKLRDQAKKLREQAAELEAKAEKVEEPIVKLQKRVAELEKEVADLRNRSYIKIWNTYPEKDKPLPSYPFWHINPTWEKPTIICDTAKTSSTSSMLGMGSTPAMAAMNEISDLCSSQRLANRL